MEAECRIRRSGKAPRSVVVVVGLGLVASMGPGSDNVLECDFAGDLDAFVAELVDDVGGFAVEDAHSLRQARFLGASRVAV